MKTIGLIGGMSWESSLEYYRIVNETIKLRLGGLHSAQCLMYSVDFAGIERLQHAGRWDEAGDVMADAARRLERGGADFVVLCTNTMHRLAGAIEAAVSIPLLHIADPTAEAIRAAGITKIGLLGTAFTMEQEFYRGRLTEKYGLDVLIPEADERAVIHRVIYEELVLGIVREDSRAAYQRIIDHLIARGAQGIILGCTEIMLLIAPEDCPVPSFDTTTLHAVAAADFALETHISGS
ncbi:MAG: aspartate/glutamate racemase family protein [Anaerolineae bacterium]